MSSDALREGAQIKAAITTSGLDIYQTLVGSPELVFDTVVLEAHLNAELVGQHWPGPPRTRSKLAKAAVARALGYSVPSSFPRVQPRFPGQDLDVYVQQADNLQIWNEEVSATRRYVLIRVDGHATVVAVRVPTGEVLAVLDRTGTLTSKYLAKRQAGRAGSVLVSAVDTTNLSNLVAPVPHMDNAELAGLGASQLPSAGKVLTIEAVYAKLLPMVGQTIGGKGLASDRLRGAVLHALASRLLGLGDHSDTGQFPDIPCQVLEVKLQTASTVDLGLVTPNSKAQALTLGPGFRHCDTRYAVVYGAMQPDGSVDITELVLATGEDFFSEFQRFEGNVQNKKIQIPLPKNFFR